MTRAETGNYWFFSWPKALFDTYLIISLWVSPIYGAYWHDLQCGGVQSEYAGRDLCLEYLFAAGTTRVSNSCM